jgi:hypothetical protein
MGGFIIGEGGIADKILHLGDAKDATIPTDGHKFTLDGATDGADGGAPIKVLGTDSLFNPFYIFRYSKFAEGTSPTNAGTYKLDSHTQVYDSSKLKGILGNFANILKSKQAAIVENPTATVIKDWADKKAELKNGPTYPYPYSLNDFTWCKWYGKIPNNRLLTLRRYTIPVEDNLAVASSKLPLVPIAQAVTWWGGETSNTLSSILGMTYGFNWKTAPANVQDVTGNEVNIEKAIAAVGVSNPNLAKAIKLMFANNPDAFSGRDKILQDSMKEQWGPNGAYSNRIKGPVNVINNTQIRDVGYTFTHPITLTFEYNLRSYGNINPKVAMLDLITNFLSLTHNKATFWGGSYRYYQQTGAILPGLSSDALDDGDYIKASEETLAMLAAMVQGGSSDLATAFNSLSNDLGSTATVEEFSKKLGSAFIGSNLGKNLAASRLKELQQKPLLMRAMLDGRAVGEWHLMVGNPMDPIAVIGNLCMKTTAMAFSEDLGADDFPTSVKFTVVLEPGRHRAKQDIESMFNHGGGDMGFTALEPPSSTMGSYGEYTTSRLASAHKTSPGSEATADPEVAKLKPDLEKSVNAVAAEKGVNVAAAENYANYFKAAVANKYGAGFAKSGILVDYFTKVQTKD